MKPPTLAQGTLEQAVFAWTSRTVSNVRGQGYAAVSDGLKPFVPWLESIDRAHFKLLDQNVPDSRQAYKAWRTFESVGYLRVDGLGIAYKKMANGGDDEMGRPRHVVHVIVGTAVDVTLQFALLLADDKWRTVAECPVGMDMRLPQLSRTALDFDLGRLSHDCDSADPLAWRVLEQLRSLGADALVRLGVTELAQLPMIVHAALPGPCRDALELDCFAGVDGPAGYLGVGAPDDSAPAGAELPPTELAQCMIYRELSPQWPQVPSGALAWPGYRALLSGTALPDADAVKVETPDAGQNLTATADGGETALTPALLAEIRMARAGLVGTDLNLAEPEALAFLARCERSDVMPQEILGLSRADLEMVLGSITSKHGYWTVAGFLRACEHDLLLHRWRTTGLCVLGYAALQTWPTASAVGPDTVLAPESCPPEQLATLIGHLLSTDEGLAQIALLLRHGFGAQRKLRELFLESLGEDGRKLLHPRILEGARLPPEQLREIIRDTFPEWCAHHRIRDDEAEALDGALSRRFQWIGAAREALRLGRTGRPPT
jgi:hypothetical protein